MKNSASNPTPTHTIPLAAVILPSIASRASDQSWILLTCFMPMLRHRLPVELKITVKTISTAVRVRSPGCDIVSRYAPAPGAYAANDYSYAPGRSVCHYENRTYYDARGRLVTAPTQVCG